MANVNLGKRVFDSFNEILSISLCSDHEDRVVANVRPGSIGIRCLKSVLPAWFHTEQPEGVSKTGKELCHLFRVEVSLLALRNYQFCRGGAVTMPEGSIESTHDVRALWITYVLIASHRRHYGHGGRSR